jgi:TPR repeat protein
MKLILTLKLIFDRSPLASSSGDADPLYHVGLRLYHGGRDTNYPKAFHYFRLAAEKGHSDAQFYLGTTS